MGEVGNAADVGQVDVGKDAVGAVVGDGVTDRLERGVRLGVADDVRRVGAGGAGLSVDGTGVERTVVVGEGEDVLLFEVLEEAMEVGEILAATGEVGALWVSD